MQVKSILQIIITDFKTETKKLLNLLKAATHNSDQRHCKTAVRVVAHCVFCENGTEFNSATKLIPKINAFMKKDNFYLR